MAQLMSSGHMNAPLPIRAKLIAAALMLVVVSAFATLHDIGARSLGEAAFRVGCVVFSVLVAYIGAFGSAQLHLLWGWGLVVSAPALAALCIFVFRGSDFIFGLLAMAAAVAGGYLLLMDASVKRYRADLRRRHVA